MKRILYFAMTIITVMGFVACNDDDDGNVIISSNPQVESEGTYTGKWTIKVTQKEEGGTEETLYDGVSDGSITLSASGAYISEVTFDGDVIKEYMSDVLTKNYNVAQMNNGGFTLINTKDIITSVSEKDIDVGVEGATETTRTIEDVISLGYGEISPSNELVFNGYSRKKQVVTGWKEPRYNSKGKQIGTVAKTNNTTTNYQVSFTGAKGATTQE